MSVAIITLFIPIVAILAGTYIKTQRMKLEAGRGGLSSGEIKAMMDELYRLKNENEELNRRLSNVETIVTEEGWEKLPQQTDKTIQKELERMAQELKSLKEKD
jgi:hypothetical protein